MQLSKKQQELKDDRGEAKVEQQRLLSLAESAAAEAAQLRAELGSREADLVECRNQNSCLSMERMRESQKMSVMEETVESMRSEAQRSIEELGKQHAIAEKLRSSMGLVQAELASEQRKAQEAVGVKSDLESRIQSLQDEVQTLQSEQIKTQEELNASREREKAALERVEEFSQEVNECTAALCQSEAALKRVSSELDACKEELVSKNNLVQQLGEALKHTRVEAADAQVWALSRPGRKKQYANMQL